MKGYILLPTYLPSKVRDEKEEKEKKKTYLARAVWVTQQTEYVEKKKKKSSCVISLLEYIRR